VVCEDFGISKCEGFVSDAFSYFEPAKRACDRSDMTGFSRSTCKRVLNLLEAGNLTFRELPVKRITVIEFGVNDGGGSGTSCCGIEVRTDTAKLPTR